MNIQNLTGESLIGGRWVTGDGASFKSTSPSSGTTMWEGNAVSAEQVGRAFDAARDAQGRWWDQPLERRIEICLRFAEMVKSQGDSLAELISLEMGKTRWEARSEVATVVAKIGVSIEALRTRRDTQQFEMNGLQAVTRFKPYGVMSVLGPFNFPAHLPNGHIVPALLAGNTVVFKPSEQTPAVGEWMVRIWESAGLPIGVINLVQGGREVGMAAANPDGCDGLLFTGSGSVGRALHRAFADYPQKILALEMGGNNPLIVDEVADLAAAAYQILLSSFITSGQRCTCARRLIVVERPAHFERLMMEMTHLIKRTSIGYHDDSSEPFYGPVINRQAGEGIRRAFQDLAARGGRIIAPMEVHRDNPALLSPGLIDVTDVQGLADEEVFGPLLSVTRAANLDAAIEEANRTRYGLSAGLLSDSIESYRRFIHRIRAGIVNWNRQTTGASGKLPFGGCGLSGNSRPAGFYSADYCSFPVASLESNSLTLPSTLETGIKFD